MMKPGFPIARGVALVSVLVFATPLVWSCTIQQQGCAIGGGIGVGIGYLVGGKPGALIGLFPGLLAGCTWGRVVEQRRAQYISAEAFYDAEIQETEALNRNLALIIEQKNAEIATLDRTARDLQAKREAGIASKSAIARAIQETEALQREVDENLRRARQWLALKSEVLAKMKREGASARAAALQTEIETLEKAITSLSQEVDLIAAVGGRLNF